MRTGSGAGSRGPTPAQEGAPVSATVMRGSSEAGSHGAALGAALGDPDPAPAGDGSAALEDAVGAPHAAHSPAQNNQTVARPAPPPPMPPPLDAGEI
ncbi:MAG: hypothetical protein ACJ79H_22230 [Myxococcales bacterium]